MKLRGLYCMIATGIMSVICSSATYAQPRCLAGDDLTAATRWLQLYPPNPSPFWGVRFAIIRFTADLNPEALARLVIQDALIEWNTRACDTGIFFIPFNSDVGHDFADITFRRLSVDSDDTTGGCIGYLAEDNGIPINDINYGPNFITRLNTLPREQNVAVVMHELGHVLGFGPHPSLKPDDNDARSDMFISNVRDYFIERRCPEGSRVHE